MMKVEKKELKVPMMKVENTDVFDKIHSLFGEVIYESLQSKSKVSLI